MSFRKPGRCENIFWRTRLNRLQLVWTAMTTNTGRTLPPLLPRLISCTCSNVTRSEPQKMVTENFLHAGIFTSNSNKTSLKMFSYLKSHKDRLDGQAGPTICSFPPNIRCKQIIVSHVEWSCCTVFVLAFTQTHLDFSHTYKWN